MIRLLRANKRQHGIHHPLLAIDCENNPDTGCFICGGIYGDIRHRTSHREGGKVKVDWTTKRVDRYFTKQAEFIDFISSLPRNSCMLVFFNLGYDKVYIDPIVDHDSVLASGQRMITLKIKGSGIKAIDLTNHVDGSLEQWIGYLDMKAKHGVVKADLSDNYNRVMNDARATYHLGSFLEDFYYHECGIPLCLTVGAAALRLFTMKFFIHYWRRDDDFMSNYERQAFYGGRVEIYRRGKFKTWGYDVNSMYLSIMRDCEVPDMSTGLYMDYCPKDWQRYLKQYLGVWQVRVRCPSSINLPVLPFRIDGKLKFPVGEFRGYFTSVELLAAIDAGYEILEVYDFVYYRSAHRYFAGYADFVWQRRAKYRAAGNKGMSLMIKKMGNALYGKFAQRNGRDYFGRLSDFRGDLPDEVQFYDYRGDVWILAKGERVPAAFEFPAISAFITSYARLKLYHAMKANEDALIYCDTDSIKLSFPARGIPVSDDLGDWGLEVDGMDIEYYRPKLYGDKRKGIPKRAELLQRSETGEVWRYRKPLREREAIKADKIPNVWVEVVKHIDFIDDKRWWFDGDSRPIELTILIEGEAGSVNILAIPVDQRYREKVKVSFDRDYRSKEDQQAIEQERLDRRRDGIEIYQRT